jgi:hypothetical protein
MRRARAGVSLGRAAAPRQKPDTSALLPLRRARIATRRLAGRVLPSDFSHFAGAPIRPFAVSPIPRLSHHAMAILSSTNALLTATARSLRTRAQS